MRGGHGQDACETCHTVTITIDSQESRYGGDEPYDGALQAHAASNPSGNSSLSRLATADLTDMHTTRQQQISILREHHLEKLINEKAVKEVLAADAKDTLAMEKAHAEELRINEKAVKVAVAVEKAFAEESEEEARMNAKAVHDAMTKDGSTLDEQLKHLKDKEEQHVAAKKRHAQDGQDEDGTTTWMPFLEWHTRQCSMDDRQLGPPVNKCHSPLLSPLI